MRYRLPECRAFRTVVLASKGIGSLIAGEGWYTTMGHENGLENSHGAAA